MEHDKFKTAYRLTLVIAVLASLASAGGLWMEGIYRDEVSFKRAFQGNDLVTLFLAVPLLLTSIVFTRRGKQQATLIWVAMLGYMVYNYAFYLFGAAFNRFFQVYVALFALSLYALIFVLTGLDAAGISRRFDRNTPIRWIGAYMLFIGLFLGVFEFIRSLSLFTSGQPPTDPTLVFALDLSLIVPAMVTGAIWLWQRRPWGYVLAAMMTVKGATYGLALVAMAAFVAGFRWSGNWDPFTPFYVFVAAGGILASLLLFRHFNRQTP